MDCVKTVAEEHVEGMEEEHDHDHDEDADSKKDSDTDKHDEHEDKDKKDEHDHDHDSDEPEQDEHVWTSPQNADVYKRQYKSYASTAYNPCKYIKLLLLFWGNVSLSLIHI